MFEWFQGIVDFFAIILFHLYNFTGNYGMAIIVLTLVVRLLTFPLMAKQMKSTSKMQSLQPELKKIQEKYKDDKETLNKKTMELWQKHNVNPMAGCLPLIVQMPVLLAIFRTLHQDRMAEFIPGYDPYLFQGLELLNLNLPDPLYILPILAGATTWLHQKLTMGSKGASSSSSPMSSMMIIMPLMLVFISAGLPAGLPLYFVVGNIFSMLMHVVMEKFKGSEEEAEGVKQK